MVSKIQNIYPNLLDRIWIRTKYGRYINMYTKNKKRVALQRKFPLSESQKKGIDEYYMTYYGCKIPHECHQNFAVHTGVFRPDYFADFLFVPLFEHFINGQKDYVKVLEDKSVFPYVAATANVKMPKTILYNSFGVFRGANHDVLRGGGYSTSCVILDQFLLNLLLILVQVEVYSLQIFKMV